MARYSITVNLETLQGMRALSLRQRIDEFIKGKDEFGVPILDGFTLLSVVLVQEVAMTVDGQENKQQPTGLVDIEREEEPCSE